MGVPKNASKLSKTWSPSDEESESPTREVRSRTPPYNTLDNGGMKQACDFSTCKTLVEL